MLKINLLPLRQKKELKLTELACSANFLIIGLLACLMLFSLLLIIVFATLTVLVNEQTDLISMMENQEEAKLLTEKEGIIIEGNNHLNKILDKQKEIILSAPILKELSEIIPERVYLKNISYYSASGEVTLSGWANDREDLLSFKDLLEQSSRFSDINLPLANLIKQNDIDFNFSIKTQ